MSVPLTASFKSVDASSIAFLSISETLVQSSMKLGEAIYKSQEKKESSSKEGEEKKDDNVVDADFEEVKEEEAKEVKKEDKEKSA